MTDQELMQMALDVLEGINQCSLPPTDIPLPAEIDHVMEALRARLAQPEPEPVATLFGSLPVYDVPLAKPVAWVENLENARPHCVTDLKYCSVAQHERGEHLKYIPLYKDPTPCQTCEALARTVLMDQTSHDIPKREWQGLTEEDIAILWKATPQLVGVYSYTDISREVEAKLKEKNS